MPQRKRRKPARVWSAEEKLKIIKKVAEDGRSVTEVCQQFGISRKTFYKWKKRLDRAPEVEKTDQLKALKDQKPATWQQATWQQTQEVLDLVLRYPEYSARKLAENIPSLSNHGVQRVLERNDLNTIEKRKRFALAYFRVHPETLLAISTEKLKDRISAFLKLPVKVSLAPLASDLKEAKRRLAIVQAVIEKGKPVTAVCEKYHISRKTFYKWKARFDAAPLGEKLKALVGIQPVWSGLASGAQVKEVLTWIVRHPEYSVGRLASVVNSLGAHGIQRVLERASLNHYSQRLAYQRAYLRSHPYWYVLIYGERALIWVGNAARSSSVLIRVIRGIRQIGEVKRIDWVYSPASALLSVFSIIFAVGTILFTRALLLSQSTLTGKIGILFSEVSLIAGFFFFLYSMKYYFTLAMVLAYSRQKGIEGSRDQEIERLRDLENRENKIQNGNKDHRLGSGLLRKVNGFVNGPSFAKATEGKNGNGLSLNNGYPYDDFESELSDPRNQPFISIHIPLYNEKRVVERVIRACAQQDYDNFEVLVLDDSTDETTGIAERVALEINERVRNAARANSTSEVSADLSTEASAKVDPTSEVYGTEYPRVRVLHRPTRQGLG